MADDTHWKMLLFVLSVLAIGLQYTSGLALPKIQIPSNLLPGSEVTRLQNIGQSFKLDNDGEDPLDDIISDLFEVTQDGILKTKNYLDHLAGTGFVVHVNHRTDSDSWREAISVRIGDDVQTYEGYISENNKIGAHVLGLEDLSKSFLDNSILSLSGEGSSKFHVQNDGSKVQIVADEVLDHEDKAEYDLTLTTFTEDLYSSDSTSVLIHIKVLDENDNAPIFTQVSYIFSIAEESPAGTIAGTVRATDADEGSNSNIVYFIASSEGDLFTVDTHSGEIKVTKPSNAGHYELLISASDEGKPSLSSVEPAKVIIEVPSSKLSFHPYGNDMLYPPSFNQFSTKSRSKRAALEDEFLTLEETLEVGAVIHTVPSTDEADRFALDKPNDKFAVGETSGEITLVKSLDFETSAEEIVDIRITNLNESRKYQDFGPIVLSSTVL